MGTAKLPPFDAVSIEAGADVTPLLRKRLRLALILCLAPIGGFAIFDLWLADPERLAIYYGLKLAAVAIVIGVFAWLGPPRARAEIVAVGLIAIAIMFSLSSLSAILAGEPETTPILVVAVALGTATLLPWGIGPQIAVAAIAALSTVATVYGATGSLAALLQYPTIGVAIGLGLSVFVADEFDRTRQALARRHREQRRAEAAVRKLNEELEERVTQRTVELARLYGERERSEAAVSAIIENAGDAIWSIDREYRLIVFNSAAAERFRSRFGSELRPEMDVDARLQDEFERHWKPLYDRGLAGERFVVEQTARFPSGPRHYRTAFNPIVSGGAITGLAIFSADVTEHKRAEEQVRRHLEELTHVLRLSTMGEMAAGLAHEINQPLAAIVSYAQGCARRLCDEPSEVAAVRPVIDAIAGEALRAGEIIRRLRSLIRKEPARRDWMDLNEAVAAVVGLLAPEARRQRIAVSLQLEAALPRILADPIQIEQVVLNLMRNAIEAMSDVTGPRELRVSTGQRDGPVVHLSIDDTGTGLPAVEPDRVFEAFFSTKPTGLGMGLSISRTIVEAHEGRLVAIPKSGPGASFELMLPIQPADLTALRAAM